MNNRMKTEFAAIAENEAFARTLAAAFVAPMDPTVEELTEIKTAVSEAVSNCIIHGYRGTSGTIRLETKLYSDRTVKIKIADRGCGIEDVNMAKLPLFTTDTSGERGGMGFAIMESFSDKLTVVSKPGLGTAVTMTKKLK